MRERHPNRGTPVALLKIHTPCRLQAWEDVQEFYGCGKFVSDSWRIFCRGELSLQVLSPHPACCSADDAVSNAFECASRDNW